VEGECAANVRASVRIVHDLAQKSVSIRDTEDPEIGNAEDAEIAERRFGLRVLRALRVEEF
jgi:hypothetical protein